MELEEDIKIDVFKYYSPTYGDGVENTGFKDGQIFFQNPKLFNDPWDSRGFNFEFSNELKELIKSGVAIQLSEKVFVNSEKGLNEAFFEDILDKMGVFCLSFLPDSQLMWSHYADNHRGYVVHFEFSVKKLQSEGFSVFPVYYTDETLNLLVSPSNNNKEPLLLNKIGYSKILDSLLMSALILKSCAWSYEKEVRFLLPKKNPDDLGLVDIDKKYIKSIILGSKIEDEFKKHLKDIANNEEIEVYEASMSKNFNIEILDVKGCPKEFQQYCGEKATKNYQDFIDCIKKHTNDYNTIVDFIAKNNATFENLKKEEIEEISK